MTRVRIWPGRPLANLLLLPALLSLGVLASEAVKPPVIALDAIAAAVAIADLATLRGSSRLRVSRDCQVTCSIGEPHLVRLAVENPGTRPRRIRLRDDVPPAFAAEPAEFRLDVPGKARAELEYRMVPGRRGAYRLDRADALVGSRLGLWQAAVTWPLRTEVSVYPDVRQIARYTLLARRDRLSAIGLRSSRRMGNDNEFERLRDYIEGDDPRTLDWRATARRQKLTVRAHQQDQSQRVVFLVDCGRMMAGDTGGGLSPLDHALNATLLLAHVALSRNDQVGLMAYSDRTLAYVPPTGGPRRLRRLVHAVHDLFPEPVESDHGRALIDLESRCRKRSLVILLTNLFDEVAAGILAEHLKNLTGRHLPLAVLLRDHDLFAMADAATRDDAALCAGAASADLLNWRERVLAGLRREGVLTLDAFPDELTAALVSRYLAIKARHLL
ncbi:hypothetical protein OJF2_24590 [Aquisphaera giovannonii]|uniref:DUF58 domain-containing protein n=1 Tax=Aquisphaera giovannonii TaxID=406548 RepID=A0A5B9W0V3_9BACT|nr:DUF58 domain-containing protein [Aquisphaera giovannonii]QEH33927.1 hypothetical protein OJF2_24590 [Aquisphaera giovannonii]